MAEDDPDSDPTHQVKDHEHEPEQVEIHPWERADTDRYHTVEYHCADPECSWKRWAREEVPQDQLTDYF